MKHLRYTLIVALLSTMAGCEFTNSPLLVEGAFVNASFRVDQEGLPANTPFGTAAMLRLTDVLDNVSAAADSIKIYNITVMIDSTAGSAPAATPISGLASIDGITLFSLDNVPLSSLGREHSIFDASVPGCSFNASGVLHLVQSLRQNPPPDVSVAVIGSSSAAALHFTLHVKIYTQVYTTP